MKINKNRLLENIKAQGEIGWIEGEGLNRICYSPAFVQARDFVASLYTKYDIPYRVDSLGNIFGTIEGKKKDSIILSGSHLDSVKNGGFLDGAYGVMAAQEVAITLKEAGITLNNSYESVGFNAEEGSPLGGSFGSRGFAGLIDPIPPAQVLSSFGVTPADISAAFKAEAGYRAFVELHIEQGPVLDNNNLQIGVPQAIVGITRYRCSVKGAGNHAGTTPMLVRKDALFETMKALVPWVEAMKKEPVMVCNIGDLKVLPGHVAVIPEQVDFTVEIRALDNKDVSRAVENLKKALGQITNGEVTIEFEVSKPPVELDPMVRELIYTTSTSKGYATLNMPSGASHDASPLSHKMPTGMIFVPSIQGISHHKGESTSDADLALGAQLLLEVVLKLDDEIG